MSAKQVSTKSGNAKLLIIVIKIADSQPRHRRRRLIQTWQFLIEVGLTVGCESMVRYKAYG